MFVTGELEENLSGKGKNQQQTLPTYSCMALHLGFEPGPRLGVKCSRGYRMLTSEFCQKLLLFICYSCVVCSSVCLVIFVPIFLQEATL